MHVDGRDGRLGRVKLRHRRGLRLRRVMRMLRYLRMMHRMGRMTGVGVIHLHVGRLWRHGDAVRGHRTPERLMREWMMGMNEAVRAHSIRHTNF
jgi:hypothetical protein